MAKNTPQAIRGTQDIFEDAEAFSFVVDTFERVRKLYRFRRIEMPVFEKTEVFSRPLGETTDVVTKEMYSFEDRGGESLTLRPEFTAGIARAYLTNGWQQHAPLKVATHGPLFRYERPQKGRFRQFHQINAEILGAGEPQADVELLAMADQLLRELGIEGVTLHLNTLGDPDSREAWRAALVEYFEAHRGDLSEDSVTRLEHNPLRILDSKDRGDMALVKDAPTIDDYLTDEARSFFGSVTSGLDAAGVTWRRSSRLVRGFDYYRHTAFEFIPDEGSAAADALGSQSTVLGGGRYDGLMETLGGAHTPSVGWAAGIERLAMLIPTRPTETPDLWFIQDDPGSESLARELLAIVRREGIWSDMAFSGSIRKQFDKVKRDLAAVRVVAVQTDVDKDIIGRIRLRDIWDEAPPVRERLKGALSKYYVIDDDSGTRVISLIRRKK
ncbi:histidine--tRNA ligase [Qipengyuania atrilutea]|uniref:Histidine--tRNA ligase n=1 Tax=Qipengyuania atrilutea TaxID=2744473 RepID=A0A850GYM0_9SPHN|nr:histidine--tRNA ligase [Actirhodobacter atriluteus]NVD44701.1 histidine--tRNA ligase [Actirhodobacter atriluteus]